MKNKQLLFVGLFSLMMCADVVLSKLEVASFNIQVLGVTKVGKPLVVDELVKVRMSYTHFREDEVLSLSHT